MDDDRLSRVFAALADPTRRDMVARLAVGDATVGKRVNIGAGTITMNYTAARTKERTEIGDDAFIGSDSLLRAPIRVGKGAITGGGSVVTKDVPDGTVAVGVPARAIKKVAPKRR